MKQYISILLFLTAAGFLSAQVGTQDAASLGDGLDNTYLKELSLDKFEIDGSWGVSISSDAGFASARMFDGGPSGKTPIPDEEGLNLVDNHVLGVRIDFLRRGLTSIFVVPERPIPVEGIAKTVSVWVAGRNYNHTLVLLVQDYYGRYFELEAGKLNFQGWKQLVVAIPPQPDYGRQGIVQRDLHYVNLGGIKITGFRIDVDPLEAYGSYFVYFDDLRVTTDLFADTSSEPDDPADDW
jgi:hypothetical protein